MVDRLQELVDAGVAVWLDDLSRSRIDSGNLADLVAHKHVVGATSNPTIFAKAMRDAAEYAPQAADLARRKVSLDEAIRAMMTFDVRAAADVFRPAFDASHGVDGRVSLEVAPQLAHDTAATVAEAKALWWLVDRPNLFIKIPATAEGIPAIADALAAGVSVNVTLIFGLARYREVMGAFLDGMERAKAAGHDVTAMASVASFFVSRVDTEVDKRLHKIGSPEAQALRGKAAIANARLAFEEYEKIFGVDGVPRDDSPDARRWAALHAAGVRPQRPLWASTSTKDPSRPDTMYVDGLVTRGVVNTMPEGTIDAFADHGEVSGDTVRGGYEQSRQVLAELAALGVDYDDVVQVLEDEGVAKFDASWADLSASVQQALGRGHE